MSRATRSGDEVVCENCAAEAGRRERPRVDAEVVCAGVGGTEPRHDWSDPTPLSRLVARVRSSSYGLSIRETSDGTGEWRWAEVVLEDRDEVGASEAAQSVASREGFSFVGLAGREDGAVVLTFNRKVGDQ